MKDKKVNQEQLDCLKQWICCLGRDIDGNDVTEYYGNMSAFVQYYIYSQEFLTGVRDGLKFTIESHSKKAYLKLKEEEQFKESLTGKSVTSYYEDLDEELAKKRENRENRENGENEI